MNKEDLEAVDTLCKEILKYIDRASREKVTGDRTYQSIIKKVTKNGYVVLDQTGNERTVKCCIPGLELRELQRVWVKEPLGDLKKLHICGVVGNQKEGDTNSKTNHS